MAKDGTSRGGARIGSGRKPNALTDKISQGKDAMVIEFPESADFRGEDIPPVKDFMKAAQKSGVDLCAEDVFRSTYIWLKERGCDCKILYMDADVRTLIRRYKESRRPHPLATRGSSVEAAVYKEMELLAPIRERADYVVNSSNLTLGMLQSKLFSLFAGEGAKREIDVTVMSFGYKYGLPMDADLVFDVRFLPNPFYVEELRPLCGLDLPVAEFVFSYQQTRTFMEKITDMLDFLLPLYIEEGKLSLTVAIGCTGGRHRSVAIAAALHDHLRAEGLRSVNINRDIEK